MKKIIVLLLAALMLAAVCACRKDTVVPVKYRTNAECVAVCENAEKKITLEGGYAASEEDELTISLLNYLNEAVEKSNDHCVRFTGGMSFDEYGLLRCADENTAKDVKALIEKYLKDRAGDDLYRSYFPDEEYKLDRAEVRIFGTYVAFATLSDANRAAFFSETEKLLKET